MAKTSINLTQANLDTTHSNTIYIISEDIVFDTNYLEFGDNSVLQFQGGSISCSLSSRGSIILERMAHHKAQ